MPDCPVAGQAADAMVQRSLNAVANLDRVRVLKKDARDAKVVSRHQRALAAARRREELQAAAETAIIATVTGERVDTAGDPVPLPGTAVWPAVVPVDACEGSASGRRAKPMLVKSSQLGTEGGVASRAIGVRVPSTAATVLEWASLWVKMCSGPESGLGPLKEDDVRARYGLTAKQLRNVRHAATSGALRQRATVLGVELPPSYVDNPPAGRVDGHDMAAAAA